MTSEKPVPPPKPEEPEEDDFEPGDLVIELIDGVPHVYTKQ